MPMCKITHPSHASLMYRSCIAIVSLRIIIIIVAVVVGRALVMLCAAF